MVDAARKLLNRLDDDGVDALLARLRQSGHLATVTPRGLPQVSALWFWWSRPVLWMVTFRDTLRVRDIAANPEVAFSVDLNRFPASGATLRGRAELVEPDRTLLERIVERYLPHERVAEYVDRYYNDPNRVMIRLESRQVSGWDAGSRAQANEEGKRR